MYFSVNTSYKINMSVWKLYKGKIILIVLVIIGILFMGIMLYKSHTEENELKRTLQQEHVFQQIVDTCSNRQYEQALELTSTLQEPYKSYYKDYITSAMELEGWIGTEQELYAWLEDYFKFFDESGYIDTEFSDDMGSEIQVWSIVNDIKIKFDKEKVFISEAFVWQPQYNQIVCDYYTGIYQIMWQNREFFNGEVIDGMVQIPVLSIVELDERAFNLYKTSSSELENLQNSYSLNDDFKTLFSDELGRMEDVYNIYSKYAISSMINENYREREMIFFSEEGAENNYEVLSNAYTLNGLYLSSEEQDRGWIWNLIAEEELPEYVNDISAAAFDLYIMVKEIYPNVEIEIIESELVDDGTIFEEIFSEDFK